MAGNEIDLHAQNNSPVDAQNSIRGLSLGLHIILLLTPCLKFKFLGVGVVGGFTDFVTWQGCVMRQGCPRALVTTTVLCPTRRCF